MVTVACEHSMVSLRSRAKLNEYHQRLASTAHWNDFDTINIHRERYATDCRDKNHHHISCC